MPAAIDTMMWTGERPWHGLGTEMATAPRSGREALHAAGLDWTVRRERLSLDDGRDVRHTAVVRADNDTILGVVGPAWRPYQNHQMADLFDPMIQDGRITVETAGSLYDGQRVWMMGRLGGDLDVDGRGDIVRKYLLLGHGHDGTMAVRFGLTPIRVVCANTLTAAVNSEQSKTIRCLHTANLSDNLTALRNALSLADEQFELSAEQYRNLAKRGVSYVDLREYSRVVHGLEKDEAKWSPAGRKKMRETLAAAREGRGNSGSTWWHAYNGATEWLTYNAGRSSETRLNNNWFGDGRAWNASALRTALEMSS